MALTEKDVHDAADELNDSGAAPSYRAVRAKLGRGSFSQIRDWLRTWRPKNRPQSAVMPPPSEVSALALTMSNDLWLVAMTKAEAAAHEQNATTVLAKEKAEADLAAMADTADEFAAENDRLRAENSDLSGRFEQACQWGRERELEAVALKAEVETLRGALREIVKPQRAAKPKRPKRADGGSEDGKKAA